MDELVIGFAGLTHLGVNSLAAAAERGFNVLGFDENRDTVDAMLNGQIDINEDGLKDLLKKNSDKIMFSSDPTTLRNCDIIYISIDVPTDENANSNLNPIESIIHLVLKTVKEQTLIVVLCQVPPGFTRQIQLRHSNTYYQVETLIFGRAVERAMHPERFIIGCVDPNNIDSRLAHHLKAYDCPILPMKFESAELCKTAINLFLAASVSTANTLADICERIGADWSEITPSLRLDRRIGQHAYIETGLGLSGGNIERDLRTVQSLGVKHGADLAVVESYMSHSSYRKNWLVEQFEGCSNGLQSPKIGVLGLSYKENTHSIKNSPSIAFLEKILVKDIR
ncbi:GDP-mannose dehydrogenase, partial [Alphaproteobacteria bacterium]|nr:GDP-mannose dehydrogenase [Alphaproteobacteria bacterium]